MLAMVFGTSVIRNSEHSKVKKNRGFLWINEKSPFVIEHYREALGRIPAKMIRFSFWFPKRFNRFGVLT